jgi:peroxiredoxin
VKTKVLTILAIVLFLAVAALGGKIKQGKKAPDFTLPDIDGNNVTLSKVIGNGPIYIDFWATWCVPCKKAMPELIRLYKEYKDRGFKILSISVDDSRTRGKVKSFVKEYKMNFTVLLDSNGEVFRRKYKGRGIPYGILLDNKGLIIHRILGYLPGIDKTLAEKMEPHLISTEESEDSESPDKKNAEKDKPAKESAQKATAPKKEEAEK